MPIEALPPSTVQIIGSTQCLTDPSSAVKELVDNAIDAHATAIFVDISTNTLDRIQVKDNGYGIAPEDRGLVCKQYCTSKIRDLDDLHKLGGQSLGFRGEALASAVDMSGHVVLTTRVDGETTAVETTYDKLGLMTNEKLVSHPVGTTVIITDFLVRMPVRRQTALKEKSSAVQLAKIKRLLQAYALARPSIRLSLKVLKAKSDKSNWVYAPKHATLGTPRATLIRDAATKIFTMKAADQCRVLSWGLAKNSAAKEKQLVKDSDIEFNDHVDFVFQALVPSIQHASDLTTMEKPRQFLSIDFRPVSNARGIFKQIVSTYRKCFKSAMANRVDKFSDPILCLNIKCRRGSYDPNVEPAKDDVLFEDPAAVLGAAEKFFHLIYGKPSTIEPKNGRSDESLMTSGPDLLLAGNIRKSSDVPPFAARQGPKAHQKTLSINTQDQGSGVRRPSSRVTYPTPSIHSVEENVQSPSFQGAMPVQRTMYGSDDDDLLDLQPHSNGRMGSSDADDDVDRGAINDISISNPWAFAKMNAAVRKPTKDISPEKSISSMLIGLPTPKRQHGDIMMLPPASRNAAENVEEPSSLGPHSPVEAWLPPPFPFPQQVRGRRLDGKSDDRCHNVSDEDEPQMQGALDSWLWDSPRHPTRYSRIDAPSSPIPKNLYSRDFVSARTLPAGTRLQNIPNGSQKPHRMPRTQKEKTGVRKKPFTSPVNDPHNVWFASAERQQRPLKRTSVDQVPPNSSVIEALNLREGQSVTSTIRPIEGADPPHPDLEETMRYEARKHQALQTYRQQEKQRRRLLESNLPSPRAAAVANEDSSILTPPSSSPHHNRFLKAKAALQGPDPSTRTPYGDSTKAMEPSDPRFYLINQQSSPSKHRLSKRARTALLPLETVRDNDQLHDLTLRLPNTISTILKDAKRMLAFDEYAARGKDHEGLEDVSNENIIHWQAILKRLVQGHIARTHDDGQMTLELEEAIKIDLRAALNAIQTQQSEV